MLIQERFKSPDKVFEKVYGIFDKRDYFNTKGLAKVQIRNFENFLEKGDKKAQALLDKFKGDKKKSYEYITQVIHDKKKEQAFEDFKAFKSAVNGLEMISKGKSKEAYGAADLVKSRAHNNSQKYTMALYSAIRKQKFNNYKDIHKDVDDLLAKNEGFSSDAQRKAAFANGYEEKGKKKNESAEDAGRGVIPNSAKMKLQKAMDVLGGKKLNYMQKTKVLGKVIDSLGIDKKDLQRISQRIKSKLESVNEGKKRYYQQDGIGKSKYTISYHDGKKKHKDGSDFFDIQTFRNKKDLAKFVNTLHKGGYVYGFNESVNEAKFNKKKVLSSLEKALKNPRIGADSIQSFIDNEISNMGNRYKGSESKISDRDYDKAMSYMEDLFDSEDFGASQKEVSKLKKDLLKHLKKTVQEGGLPSTENESVNEGISVFDERHFGKKGIIIMIDDNGKKVSAIFKDKKNADKFNRNKPSDIKKLLQLAKKTKFPKAIDESMNEASREAMGIAALTGTRGVAVQDFIDKNRINSRKLFNALKKANLQGRINFASALAGKPNNPNAKLTKKLFGEDKKEIIALRKKAKSEKAFYDVLDKIEKKYGRRGFEKWLDKSLKDLKINPSKLKTSADKQEALFQAKI